MLIDRAEAAEGDAEGKTQVIGWGLGVEFFDVFGKGCAFYAIDGLLGPLLSVAPGAWPRKAVLNRRLAAGLGKIKSGIENRNNLFAFGNA